MKTGSVLKVGAVPLILAAGGVAMWGLGSSEKRSEKREVAPEPRAVETERLSFGDLRLRVEGDGTVESERTLEVVAEASGRVEYAQDDLKDGTFVRAGQVVVRLDSRGVENDLYGLRSDFLNAVASVLPELRIDDARVYRRWFDYFRSLDIHRPIPELPEITNAQEKIKVSTRDIIGKYYGVRNQEILLSRHVIRAPFDGYISSKGLIAGSFVSAGQSLFQLTDAKNLVVSVPLLVEQSQGIDFSGAPRATVFADEASDEAKPGRILRRDGIVDRNSQTLNVYVNFTNADLNPRFLPGSYVHVEIEGRILRDVASVPRHLLDSDGYVYTVEAGRLARQRLEVVAYQNDLAIVRSSVSERIVVVTTILQKPLLGMAVQAVGALELDGDAELAEEDGGADTAIAGS